MAEKKITVSVGNLVEYVLKSGDIDHIYVGSSSMREGVRIHQKLQKKRAKQAMLEDFEFEKEVRLFNEFDIEDFTFKVEGRADGIHRKNGRILVEEIKSTYSDVKTLEPHENHIHLAQAKCYGYMIAKDESLDSVEIMLTYCHVETEETAEYGREYSFSELEDFFVRITGVYFARAKKDYDRKQRRNTSIKNAPFVFENYRKGQREFAIKVYRAIENRAKLFAQAPTGTGKTVSTLFPCIKAIGEGHIDKIFYTTAKTVTRKVAEETLKRFKEKGYDLLTLTLTAKEKICMTEGICSPEHCKYARGHFDRVNAAVEDIAENERIVTRDTIRLYAEKHTVCPHEFTLDLSLWVDVVVCDYNHVFDPKVSLKRFFGDVPTEQYAFLVDEAHNLVDRSREMFSAELRKKDFLDLKKDIKAVDVPLYKLCDKINTYFTELRNAELYESKTAVMRELPENLSVLLMDFVTVTDKFLTRHRGESAESLEKLLNLYFSVLDYLSVSEYFCDSYTVFLESFGSDMSVRLLCLDPSRRLREVHEKAKVCVFFSATLTPISYFKQVFGGTVDDDGFKLPSPFPPYNLCLVIESGISTRYRSRGESYEAIADRLYVMANAKKGNYFAFFPSYAYLNEVLSVFQTKYPGITVIVQEQKLSDEEKENFLGSFDEGRNDTMLAFSVMGGVFSEGIDLTGEKLIGVAVVGVGLPLISPERDLIASYYNEKFEDGTGFEYAYVFPGINKVLQAAGRLIRTETDMGVILLIDDRYATERYMSLFPKEWDNAVFVRGQKTLEDSIRGFWY